ncbi:MAG TPA: arginine--tRNA ligase, partial [Clostridia bacterium]|nr:arginine--tRNA ligase [Clostridia bacterium]
MMDYIAEIAQAVAQAAGLDEKEIAQYIEVPPEHSMGDYAFPCFRLAKALKKAPPAIAAELSGKIIKPDNIERTETVGGYLNFFVNKAVLAENTIQDILEKGASYGSDTIGQGKTICIDYSSVNIAKPFHIGHLSTTAIGAALYRIYRFLGYKTVGINHLGDWGTQFGKLIVAYKLWGDKGDPAKKTINDLMDIYVRFHDEAEKDPSLEDEARRWFKLIEDGDSEALELFNMFKEITLREVGRIYDMLGVSFDSYAGESFYVDKMPRVVNELKAKGLLVESEGAYIVNL